MRHRPLPPARGRPPDLPPTPATTCRLRWDDGPPYEFFVRIAAHDDGRHFTLTGHLRRQGAWRVPACPPAHLLAEPAASSASGGPGGLVFIEDAVARADLAGGTGTGSNSSPPADPLHVPDRRHARVPPPGGRPARHPPFRPAGGPPRSSSPSARPRPRLIIRRPPRNGAGPPPTPAEDTILGTRALRL